MTARNRVLAVSHALWHKFRVPIFVERFFLAVCAALVIALAVTNPMNFDIQQRVSGSLAIIFAAYFAAHTIYKRSLPPAPTAPPQKVETELPTTRPQLRIVRWGQIDPAKAARSAHAGQQGFYITNFGLGEAAVGVRGSLVVPADVPDEWTSGGSSTNAVIIGKDDGEVFVPVWRKLGGFGPEGVLARFDLTQFLINVYNGKFGNQEIPVTIRYSSNGKNYVTTQNLIYSPEQRYITGFGVPVQRLDSPERTTDARRSSVSIVGEIESGQFGFRGESIADGVRRFSCNVRLKIRLTCKGTPEATIKNVAAMTITIAGETDIHTYNGIKTDVFDAKKRPDLIEKIEAQPIRQGVGSVGYLEFFVDGLRQPDNVITADVSVTLFDEYDDPHIIRNQALRIA